MSVKLTGCGPKYAALLHHAGYSHTKLLCGVTPTYLQQHLETVNSQVGVVAKVPHLPLIENWVNEAQSAPAGLIVARRYDAGYILPAAGIERLTVVDNSGLDLYSGTADQGILAKSVVRGGHRGPDKKRSANTELPGRDKRKKPWKPKR